MSQSLGNYFFDFAVGSFTVVGHYDFACELALQSISPFFFLFILIHLVDLINKLQDSLVTHYLLGWVHKYPFSSNTIFDRYPLNIIRLSIRVLFFVLNYFPLLPIYIYSNINLRICNLSYEIQLILQILAKLLVFEYFAIEFSAFLCVLSDDL